MKKCNFLPDKVWKSCKRRRDHVCLLQFPLLCQPGFFFKSFFFLPFNRKIIKIWHKTYLNSSWVYCSFLFKWLQNIRWGSGVVHNVFNSWLTTFSGTSSFINVRIHDLYLTKRGWDCRNKIWSMTSSRNISVS